MNIQYMEKYINQEESIINTYNKWQKQHIEQKYQEKISIQSKIIDIIQPKLNFLLKIWIHNFYMNFHYHHKHDITFFGSYDLYNNFFYIINNENIKIINTNIQLILGVGIKYPYPNNQNEDIKWAPILGIIISIMINLPILNKFISNSTLTLSMELSSYSLIDGSIIYPRIGINRLEEVAKK